MYLAYFYINNDGDFYFEDYQKLNYRYVVFESLDKAVEVMRKHIKTAIDTFKTNKDIGYAKKLLEFIYNDANIWDSEGTEGYFDDPDNYDENAVGNAQNTIQELDLRHEHLNGQELYPGYNLPDLDGMSIEDYYTSMIGKIAASGNNAQNLVDTQRDVVDSIDAQIKANNSVDLNEELVDLVKYQTAYAAAAQVFNAVNSCLDTLMNLGR